ncbi:MAG: hypothetical protein AAF636_19515 [Pseudomonadota bacterium]
MAPPAGRRLSVAYVLDPRFPGGTSSAVAAELEVICGVATVSVHGLETKMFKGRRAAPQLRDVLRRKKLPLFWDSAEIAADIVIFHNPSCLKFQDYLATRIIARHLIVVTHENFLRPGGELGFDVGKCLSLISACSIVLQRSLAPVSAWNRKTVRTWLRDSGTAADWSVLTRDWFNICSFVLRRPNPEPSDRRGRHSRPGFEKFPDRSVMNQCFPRTAKSNVILGADSLLRRKNVPAHWSLYPFGRLTVDQFFERIDFFVYFTAPTWRESFGRVIAEAIAAGKVVITDCETARPFSGGALEATPKDVNSIISEYVAKPELYKMQVDLAQKKLKQFSADKFQRQFSRIADQIEDASL